MALISGKKPLIILTLIVKNEEHCILRCLKSCLKLFKRSEVEYGLAIVDTGSTDRTIEIVQDWIREKGIKGGIISRPWYHFDGSRNESYCYAEYIASCMLMERRTKKAVTPKNHLTSLFLNGEDMQRMGVEGKRYLGHDFASQERLSFPRNLFENNLVYILNMDADNYLEEAEPGHAQRWYEKPLTDRLGKDCYNISLREGGGYDNHRGILFRINPEKPFRWTYCIHESCGCADPAGASGGYISEFAVVSTRDGSRSKDPLKYLRDALLCEQGLLESENDVDKSRYLFYAAQSYSCLGNHMETSNRYYKRRMKILGIFDDEAYIAGLRCARQTQDIWKKIRLLEKAMEICPFRYEAANDLMDIYQKQGLTQVAYERFRYLIYHEHRGTLFNEQNIIHGTFLMKLTLIAEDVRKKGNMWKNTVRYLEILYDQKYAMLRMLNDPLVARYNFSNVENARNNLTYFESEITKVTEEQKARGGPVPKVPWNTETGAL